MKDHTRGGGDSPSHDKRLKELMAVVVTAHPMTGALEELMATVCFSDTNKPVYLKNPVPPCVHNIIEAFFSHCRVLYTA